MFADKLQPHVIVVRGGTEPKHRPDSLSSGSSVFHALRDQFHVNDAHLTSNGGYELDGRSVEPSDFLTLGATIFHTLRGRDGARLQRACREHGAPHTGNAHTSYSEVDDLGRRQILHQTHPRTIPYWRFESKAGKANNALQDAIVSQLKYPVVISPLPDAFSVEALVVENESELREVLDACFSLGKGTTVSDSYTGNLYAVLVMNSFRGQEPYSFPARELLHNHDVANSFSRRETQHGHSGGQVSADISSLAKDVFTKLHLRDVAEVTILETPDDELYVLDVDPHPALDRHSLLFDVVGDVGATLEEVFSSILRNAQARNNSESSIYTQQSAAAGK